MQLLAIFCGVAGLGSLVALESRVVFPTLLAAFAALALRTRGRTRFVIGALALAALGCAIFAWVSHLSSHAHAGLDSELSKANMRLEIVDEVNTLRLKHGLKSLDYDAALSLVAQQRAAFAAADHSGFATAQSAGVLPSAETNMWAEMAGVACSWSRLFELEDSPTPLGSDPEVGFIEDGAHVGPDLPPPYLAADFHSMGVGVDETPGGDISVVMDFTGRPKPGAPWLSGMPNLIGEVAGIGVPDCG